MGSRGWYLMTVGARGSRLLVDFAYGNGRARL
jgi:hypothetical protein